jgi:hypothetical protein
MLFYYGRSYRAASIGTRTVAVNCDKCGTEYFYQLTRFGIGATTTPYGIGSGGASKKTKVKANEDVNRRLADEAELVPCPRCHWINEALVSGYRRSEYRNWASFAQALAILGTAISLLIAWFSGIGHAVDSDSLRFLYYVGPAVSIGLAGLIYLCRQWLRLRIRPNEGFPDPPKLPRGCPIPLVKNSSTGTLEPAPPLTGQDHAEDDWVDFQVGRSGLPAACSGCLGTAEPNFSFKRPLLPGLQLVVPYC